MRRHLRDQDISNLLLEVEKRTYRIQLKRNSQLKISKKEQRLGSGVCG